MSVCRVSAITVYREITSLRNGRKIKNDQKNSSHLSII